jgi:aerobic carbon-monoxide dehydrogenase medium subunit
MFSPQFDYYRAKSVQEAGALLKQHPGAKLLAGGHTLIPLMKLRLATPPAVIDIGRIGELKGIEAKGGVVRIGALTTHAELAASAVLREQSPALAEAAGHVGDPAVRNRGTIGGNVAHADPASDLPTVLTALGARFVVTSGGGQRTIGADQFFTGLMATALAEGDLLTVIEVPAQAAGQGSAYVKFEHPASRYAVIGVAAVLGVSGGSCTSAAVAIGGLTPRATRASAVERKLSGQAISDTALGSAAAEVATDLKGDIIGDLYASADYRKAVAPVWVKKALAAAAARVR